MFITMAPYAFFFYFLDKIILLELIILVARNLYASSNDISLYLESLERGFEVLYACIVEVKSR